MKEILTAMLAALGRGERVVLCSIFASSGSSPRGVGAKMAVFADGRTLGTVGGGAVEMLSAQRALDAIRTGSNELKRYDLHPNDVSDIGMICGGKVTVYFQLFMPENAADTAVLQRWCEGLSRDEDLWLLLSLDGERVSEFRVLTRAEIPQEKKELFTAKAVWRGECYVEPLVRAGTWAARSCRYWLPSASVWYCLITARRWQGRKIILRRTRSSSAISSIFTTRSRSRPMTTLSL